MGYIPSWSPRSKDMEKNNQDNKYLKSSLFEIGKLFRKTKHTMVDEEGLLYNARNSVGEIFSYYNIPFNRDDLQIKDKISDIDAIIKPTGYCKRDIVLDGEWWKDCQDAFLGKTKSQEIIALIPYKHGYQYYDYKLSKYVMVNEVNEQEIERKAMMFYRPLPNSVPDKRTLYKFIFSLINKKSCTLFILSALLVTLISLSIPYINTIIFSSTIFTKENSLIYSILIMFTALILVSSIFSYIKIFFQNQIQENSSNSFSSAMMAKLINLPTSFFSNYSSAELNTILENLAQLPNLLIGAGWSAIIAVISILIYIPQIILYAPSLLLASSIYFVLQIALSVVAIYQEKKLISKQLTAEEKLYAINHSLLSGLSKIKYCGAEKRALSKWLFEYRDKVALEQNPPFLIKYIDTITKLTSFIGYLIIYYIAFTSKLSPAAFIAFSLAYSLINAMLVSVIGSIEVLANITPIFEHSKPFLNTSISNTNKIYITDITGKIEFNNVSFTYPGQTNKILDNVSLTINAGEYIAIAGKTGIGKSTLFRLILGFERPQSGAIYIDGKDINNIDLSSLRKHFGTVLQNNKLLPGDILSNIKISNPSVSESQVWNVCRIANFDKDINAMPFGLNTNVGENGGNLSGGQIQRLMIARALISNPSILLFDEAMTALDYKSQKSISEAIESLPCTRIIVSHRLSTIRHCDRIIVLDKGKIVANGIYDDLEKNSPEFQDLIKKKED